MKNVFFMQLGCITTHNAQRTTHNAQRTTHNAQRTTHLVLVFLLLLCSSAFAQSSSPYKDKVDSVFANLDKSGNCVPTGILYEAGYNLVDVSGLGGQPSNKPINFQTWKALYYSLISATNPIY